VSWMRQDEYKITHLPTGHVVRAEGGRSWVRRRAWCWMMLRSKLWLWPKGLPAEMPLVRTYDLIGDAERASLMLDGDVPIGE
jgi:hypothetical protein